jgi:hypothetical protein
VSVVLTREDIDGDVARPLVVALDAELDERSSPPTRCFGLDLP